MNMTEDAFHFASERESLGQIRLLEGSFLPLSQVDDFDLAEAPHQIAVLGVQTTYGEHVAVATFSKALRGVGEVVLRQIKGEYATVPERKRVSVAALIGRIMEATSREV